MTQNEAAIKWGCSRQRVSQLLRAKRVPGAIMARSWYIPDTAKMPPLGKRGPKTKILPENTLTVK
jgi:hypothetical protein